MTQAFPSASDPVDRNRPQPPSAKREPVERTLWGETVVDDFRWLHDRSSEEADAAVLSHLRAENRYAEAAFDELNPLTEVLYDEVKARIQETDISVPVPLDGWLYYSRTTEGDSYPRHYRRKDVPGSDEVLLLDEEAEAAGNDFFDLGVFAISPDHRRLLWGSDTAGDERFRLFVRELATGEDIDDGIDDVSYSGAWATDGRTFFYTRPDAAERPYQVWRHVLGRPAAEDVLVYQEDDERFFVGIERDKDDSYLYIHSGSKVTDEVRVIPADQPETQARVLIERRQGIECSLAHHEGTFVILTNDGAENFRIVTTPEHAPDPSNWTDIVAASDDVIIAGFDVCASFLTLYERSDGSPRIRLRGWDAEEFLSVPQPEAVSATWPLSNPDYHSAKLRYGYSSMVTPASAMEYDFETGDRTVLKQQPVLGPFDATLYETVRYWATSEDGTQVPISYVQRKDRAAEPGPCLLYGYGAYEASIDPTFSSVRLSLLDRGFGVALVHARGGGELGRRWYLDGKFEQKQHTFDDVAAAARFLIETGITSAERLVLRGGSAGGLMVGAVLNQVPELFAGAIAEVPFVDALNTILDPSLPLTVTEWEEWGNPAEDEVIYRAMAAYSPYENVVAQDYPPVLVLAGLNDTRVSYWEPAKWVQELRRTKTGESPILFWTDISAGHGGPSGRYDKLKEESRNLAYMLDVAGCTS